MEMHSNYASKRAASLESAAALNEAFSFFNYDNSLTEPSPALSLLSTPALECFDTPDSVASHDFNAVNSPILSSRNSYDTFGQDFTLFDDGYVSRHENAFGDMTLFNASEEDLTSSALLDSYAREKKSAAVSDTSAAIFLPASALTMSAPEVPASPRTVSMDSELMQPPPSLSRTSSSASTFAVPLLPRGRKRKSVVSEDADFVPTAATGTNLKAKKKPGIKLEDEDDEKAILRAKNTEAAARSRARKRAAMESAENRIQELEQENASLRRLLSEKDQLLAVYQN